MIFYRKIFKAIFFYEICGLFQDKAFGNLFHLFNTTKDWKSDIEITIKQVSGANIEL